MGSAVEVVPPPELLCSAALVEPVPEVSPPPELEPPRKSFTPELEPPELFPKSAFAGARP